MQLQHAGSIDRTLFEVFLVYVLSGDRPIAEMFSPRFTPLARAFNAEFNGLTTAACGLFQRNLLALQLPGANSKPHDEWSIIRRASTSVGCNAIQLAAAASFRANAQTRGLPERNDLKEFDWSYNPKYPNLRCWAGNTDLRSSRSEFYRGINLFP